LEEELLLLMEAIEEETNKVSEAQAAFDEKKEKAEADIKAIQERKDEKQKELSGILKEREEKNNAIDPKVAETYNNLKSKLKGNLLVSANNGSCSGCFLHIPAQLINDAMKLEKVCQCPHCHRILIVH
jgi:predicted  nucleic acid-binding Zn-ribbon protein